MSTEYRNCLLTCTRYILRVSRRKLSVQFILFENGRVCDKTYSTKQPQYLIYDTIHNISSHLSKSMRFKTAYESSDEIFICKLEMSVWRLVAETLPLLPQILPQYSVQGKNIKCKHLIQISEFKLPNKFLCLTQCVTSQMLCE